MTLTIIQVNHRGKESHPAAPKGRRRRAFSFAPPGQERQEEFGTHGFRDAQSRVAPLVATIRRPVGAKETIAIFLDLLMTRQEV